MRLRAAGVLVATVLALGCSSTATPRATESDDVAAAAGQRPSASQLLVLMRPAPRSLWLQQGAELAGDYRMRQVAAWTVDSLDATPCVIYEVAPGRDVATLVKHLTGDPRVTVAQPVQRFQVLGSSGYNDPYADLQKGVKELQLHDVQQVATGKGVKVGIVDTGMDLDHPDLRGRVAGAGNYVDKGERSFTHDVHGTAVAGILAAAANNQVGIVGVAPDASLYAFKACWQEPPASRQAVCDSYTLARAVDAAIGAGVQVLNLSLSGPPDPFLSKLLGAALSRRTVVVAAYDSGQKDGGFPASRDGVLAVGAEPRPGDPPSTPGASRTLALVGPAVDVLSTAPGGGYDFFSGSSFAAAHVAGVVALLLERKPGLTPAEVRQLLVGTATGTATRLDPCGAMSRLERRPVCAGG